MFCTNKVVKLFEILIKKSAITKRISAISLSNKLRLIKESIDQNLGRIILNNGFNTVYKELMYSFDSVAKIVITMAKIFNSPNSRLFNKYL